MYYYSAYVSVAERKEKAAKKIAALKKKGQAVYPVVINGRHIVKTFWGKLWCTHLESYRDYENRLPRGRSYVRNNTVIDLHIRKGLINAQVSGSSVYAVEVVIQNLEAAKWRVILKECAGKIDSLIELLQGNFSKAVMEIITDKNMGLFPRPDEIKFSCSCPDHAYMCKHIAAVLYGVGARLDEEPEKLFLLRHVDHLELIGAAQSSDKFTKSSKKSGNELDAVGLSSLFGIELETTTKPVKAVKAPSPKKLQKKPRKKGIKKTVEKVSKKKSGKQMAQRVSKKVSEQKIKKRVIRKTKSKLAQSL